MAQRRMFSQRVVGDEKFLEMPTSAQNLYFHLGIYADDDGFVNPQRVVRMIGANPDDLKVLVAKKFVIPFEGGVVVVVTHWKENNYIQTDRYHPTVYQKEFKKLSCIQNVYNLDTEVRLELGKVRLDTASAKADAPFNFKEYLAKMDNDPKRHVQIIAFYLREKGLSFDNAKQVSTAIARHSRAAKALEPFTDAQITKAATKAAKEYPEWTIETLTKILTR